jgi:hypothetical protein
MEEFGIFENINKDLYFIGDIHGDFYAFKQALELTECVIFDEQKFENICKEHLDGIILTDGCEYYKNKINWNPKKKDSMIIFAGDLVDRCRITSDSCDFVVNDEDCDNQIINILLELDKQALKYNSRVLFVLGNHELMNLQNKLKYVSFKGMSNTSRTKNIKTTITENINNIFGLIRINNYIVCHGGINPNFVNEYYKINNSNSEFVKSYNQMLRETLSNSEPNYYLLNDSNGPFWDRRHGLDNKQLSDKECELLFFNNILNITNKNNINNLKLIVAHCPQTFNSEKKGINNTNCGKYENRIGKTIDVLLKNKTNILCEKNIIEKSKLVLTPFRKKNIAILFSGQIRSNSLSLNNNNNDLILNSMNINFINNDFKSKYNYDIFISSDEINVDKTMNYFENNVKNIFLSDTEINLSFSRDSSLFSFTFVPENK